MATKKFLFDIGTKNAKRSEKQLRGVDNATKSLMKSAMGMAGAYLSARGLNQAVKQSIKLFMAQETAENSLEVAFRGNIDSLKKYAAELQQVTLYGDEVTLGAMTMIAAFVKDEEALKKATKATMDLAAAKGFDLKTAADLVGKTLGSTTNALTRYGIVVTGAVGSTERLETLVKNTDAAFGGMAEGMVDTTEGAIIQMKNALGDLGETFGSILAPSVEKSASNLKLFFEALDEGLQKYKDLERNETLGKLVDAFKEIRNNILLGIAPLRLLKFWVDQATEGFNAYKASKEKGLIEDLKWLSDAEFDALELDIMGDVITDDYIDQLKHYANWMKEIENRAKSLQPELSILNDYMTSFGHSMAQAAIYGQSMGQAIVSALKAIAAEILAEIALYVIASMLGIPIGALSSGGKVAGLLDMGGFMSGFGNYGASSSVQPTQPTSNQPVVYLNIATLVGTDEAAVRDQLIPLLNQAMANA